MDRRVCCSQRSMWLAVDCEWSSHPARNPMSFWFTLQPGTTAGEILVKGGFHKLPELEDVLGYRVEEWQRTPSARGMDCCDCMSEASLDDVDSDGGGECSWLRTAVLFVCGGALHMCLPCCAAEGQIDSFYSGTSAAHTCNLYVDLGRDRRKSAVALVLDACCCYCLLVCAASKSAGELTLSMFSTSDLAWQSWKFGWLHWVFAHELLCCCGAGDTFRTSCPWQLAFKAVRRHTFMSTMV